ncbi:MAG TPA: NAD-dependent epimerase/dehydratase family protein [Woeseiaceae bacterium]
MYTLVVGTGYTGQRVLARLPAGAAAGLSRSPAPSSQPHFVFDIDADERLPLTLPDDYAVLYTVPPAGPEQDERLAAFLGLLSPPPSRFVYISTTGVYGDCGGRRVSESTPVHPENGRSRARVAAERLLLDWSAENRCDAVILRAPGIYGPGRLGIDRIRAAEPVIGESEAHPGNRIHVDDLASCCVAALDPGVPAGIYNVGDGDHRSGTAFTRNVADLCGLAMPPEITREEAGRRFSPMRLSFLSESRIVDTTRMRDTLGVTPRYADPVDGIRASLE